MPSRKLVGSPTVAVAYVRVSTDRQELGPEAQRAAVEAWASRAGVTIAAWHSDLGVSGAAGLEERPGLVAALAALRTHGAGVLVAAKRDRVARDTVVAAAVERAVGAAGATLRTADGASDATGAEGGLMRGIIDVFSQYERAAIRARTRAALAAKKARGELTGSAPFGYRVGDDGAQLQPDVHEQTVIAIARTLRAEGHSMRAVVAELASVGAVSRAGTPLQLTQVARMLRAA